MVELRKRPARADPPAAPPAKRSSSASKPSKVKQLATKAKEAVTGTSNKTETTDSTKDTPVVNATGVIPETTAPAGDTTGAPATAAVATGAGGATGGKLGKDSVGTKISLNGFGGEVSTNDGRKVSLAGLLKEGAVKGVVIFTYPKASTPGCTTQACLFRDSYKPITDAGYAVYGLSTDSEKANTNFVTKQKLPYPLLCDPEATLTTAIGMKKPGPGKSTSRGVVLVEQDGTVRLWEQAGPQRTLDAVLEVVGSK